MEPRMVECVRGQAVSRALRVIDATVIDDPEDADEMLAWSINYAVDGDIISIHHPFCRTQLRALEPCTCTPKTMMAIGSRA
jgi:hypothetical protein